MAKTILIPIGGPTGVGESTITKKLIELIPKTKRLVTTTSRLPRLNEQDSTDYFFITKKEFEQRIKENKFLEYTYIKNRDVYYGSEKEKIDELLNNGNNVIANIDLVGAKAMKQNYPDRCITIFIVPEKLDDIKTRILNRQPDILPDELEKRLAYAAEEIRDQDKYDLIIVNRQGKLEEAVKEAQEKIITFLNFAR